MKTYRLSAAFALRLLILLGCGGVVAIVSASRVLGLRTRAHGILTVVFDGVFLVDRHPFGHITCRDEQRLARGGKRLGGVTRGLCNAGGPSSSTTTAARRFRKASVWVDSSSPQRVKYNRGKVVFCPPKMMCFFWSLPCPLINRGRDPFRVVR